MSCDDNILVYLLSIVVKMLNIVQIIAPIVLIIMATVQLVKLVNNPDEKNGVKSIINKFLAAAIVFFVPIIVNIVLGIMPDSIDLVRCLQQVSSKNFINNPNVENIEIKSQTKKQIAVDQSDYEKSQNSSGSGSGSGSVGQGSAKGKEIATYALKFVGQQYVLGGQWDGEEPYSPTDCSGFVQAIYRHFGYTIPRTTDAQDEYLSANAQRIPEDQVQAGDIVLFIGHVGIATGNGYQMVHASDDDVGVIVTDDFRYRDRSGVFRLAN